MLGMWRNKKNTIYKREKNEKEKKILNPTPSKKELMNRSLSTITINIGKSGVKESVIEEIKRQLKAREVVKIRFSKAISLDKKKNIDNIMEKTNSKLIDLRGNVAVIFKKKR